MKEGSRIGLVEIKSGVARRYCHRLPQQWGAALPVYKVPFICTVSASYLVVKTQVPVLEPRLSLHEYLLSLPNQQVMGQEPADILMVSS